MDYITNNKLASKLSLTALLTSGLICTLSAIYSILCVVAIVMRFQCSGNHMDIAASLYLLNTIYRTYFKKDECPDTIQNENITQEETVFIFVIITLIVSLLCLGTSIFLIITIKKKSLRHHFVKAAYIYIGSCIISLILDITFGGFFCRDYIYFINEMARNSPGISLNYHMDISRLGAFILMIISLKGVFPLIINVTLIILLLIYLTEYKRDLLSNEHSIHKMGALNAYERNSREDNWNRIGSDTGSTFVRGSRINNGFTHDEARQKPRDLLSSDPSGSRSYDNAYDRSYNRQYNNVDPWRKHQNQSGIGMGTRPFSYLEEANRSMPLKTLASPAAEPSQRRDYDPWGQPPIIPLPDYSPPPRRLKSALKPTYM